MADPIIADMNEMADLLGQSRKIVREWVEADLIPSFMVGKRRFFNIRRVVDALRRPEAYQRQRAAEYPQWKRDRDRAAAAVSQQEAVAC
jgi:hypothetical protein